MSDAACHNCSYHVEYGWQNCQCLVCLPEFHKKRCIDDNKGPCIFLH